jgi:hypothetical protein
MQNPEEIRELIGWHKACKTWTGGFDYFASKGPYAGTLTEDMILAPLGLPPLMSAKQAVMSIFRAPILLERLCAADWLVPIPESKEAPVFLTRQIYMALAKLRTGAKPARLASEKQLEPGEPEIGDALTQWRYLKTSKAAEVLGISPRTLSHHAEQDTIPYLRLGKHRLYNIAEIVAHVKKTHTRERLRPGDIAAVLR